MQQWVKTYANSRVIILIVLIGVFLFSGYKILWKYVEYGKNQRLYASLRAEYGPVGTNIGETVPASMESNSDAPHEYVASAARMPEPERIHPHLAVAEEGAPDEGQQRSAEDERVRQWETNLFANSNELQEMNADTVGWIKIPDTNIDYPIVQAKDNEYYLTRDFHKKRNSGGSIFMDYRNDGKMGNTNNIIYGHNMKDKSMFQNVMNYKDKDFFDNNRIIYTYTPDGVQRWEVFLLFVTDIRFDYLVADFDTDREFRTYINAVWRKAWQKADVELTSQDKLLTLSTCSYEYDDARTVLMARLIEEI